MYYLTYRPKTIQELDNSLVKERITNLLKTKNIPHALLFVGQKGTGKTSTARIVAKSVNCLKNSFAGVSDSVEPCNDCPNCRAIEQSSSPDVLELDAASNRGIEEIRSLIKEASFSPMTSRFRVFIIDEAHMITHDAFNALLKTLEEPPASVIFILATTNVEKVPATILSRCVEVPFGRGKKADITTMLKRILTKEKKQIPDEVLALIVSHSERSFRDAAKITEELITQNKLTVNEAREYLGVRAEGSLLDVMSQKPLKDALSWVDGFSQAGGSTKNLLETLLEDLREALMAKNGVQTEEGETYGLTTGQITRLMKLFTDAYNLLRSTPIESIPLEIAVVEFYNSKSNSS